MGKSGGAKRVPVSTIVASLMVLGAGCITWYGLSDAGSSAATPVGAASATLAAEPSAPEQPAGKPSSLVGTLPTRIVAPSAGIDAPIAEVGVAVEGEKAIWETAWQSVGHHINSARPGQPGNMVLTGHVSVRNPGHLAAFKSLDRLRAGDIVEVHSGAEVYRYAVTRVAVVSPSEVRLLRSDHTSRITLITCTRDLKQRLVVVGTLV